MPDVPIARGQKVFLAVWPGCAPRTATPPQPRFREPFRLRADRTLPVVAPVVQVSLNPATTHSFRATERVLGIDGRRPTLKWNGYGEYVAHLYDGLEKERLFV